MTDSQTQVEVQYADGLAQTPAAEAFERWAHAALPDEAGLLIRIVEQSESQALNARYRGKDRPTNVLSFPFEVPPGVDCDHLGDLVICAEVVEREAAEQGKPPEHHWAHMVVHGVLHLRGYDHVDDAQADTMECLEKQILAGLDIPDPYVTKDMAV